MADNYDSYDKQELIKLLRDRDREQRFGLVWENDSIERDRALNDDFVAVDFDPDLSIGNASFDNLVIEGDNFDALRFLRMTHKNKVKCIYIDPPYNTGNQDFIYNDCFVDKEDGYRHSKWLEFMYRRLLLASDLLTSDGSIIVHIDENENHLCRALLEKIFSEDNFLGEIIWDKRNPKGDSKGISYQHEYIICFAKDKDSFSLNMDLKVPKRNAERMLKKAALIFQQVGKNCLSYDVKQALDVLGIKNNKEAYKKIYTLEDANKDFQRWISQQKDDLSGGEKAYKNIDDNGNIYQSVSMAWPNSNDAPQEYHKPLIHPITQKPCPVPQKGWRNPPDTMQKLLDRDMILFGKDEATQPRRKYLLKDNMSENLPSLMYFGNDDKAILNDNDLEFSNPKPIEVSRRLIEAFSDKDSIVLDFFGGSGTTAHAVMAQNQLDDGQRQFIIVSSSEATDKEPNKNICKDVTQKRIQAVINGYEYKDRKGKLHKVEGLGGNFAYGTMRKMPRDCIGDLVEHSQIWTALCLIHFDKIIPYDSQNPYQSFEHNQTALIYTPNADHALCDAINQHITDISNVIFYSWQNSLFNQYLKHDRIDFKPIPQELIDRFGGKL